MGAGVLRTPVWRAGPHLLIQKTLLFHKIEVTLSHGFILINILAAKGGQKYFHYFSLVFCYRINLSPGKEKHPSPIINQSFRLKADNLFVRGLGIIVVLRNMRERGGV